LEANPKTGAAERELRTLRTGFSMSRGNSERGVAGVNEHPISGKDSKNGVLSVLGRSKEAPEPQAFPFLSPGGTLVIPFNSPERYHWWKPDGNRMSVKDIINELRLRQKPITKGTSPVEQITLQQNVNPQSSQQKVMSNLQLSLPKVTSNVHFSSASNEWDTPPDFYDKLHKEFGFTLDPCCTHENAKCPKHFTQAENGLTQDWSGERVFMNPPYGREIGQWMKKAWEESRRGALVVCLVPARTDTAWWHNYAIKGTEIRYIRGRLKFGGAANSAPFPSAVVIFNPCT
jgi:site-specific DNA-methyltransferase (adenine-specific)